jgi:hypothetical protein
MAAVLTCGSGAVLSHRDAAALWRIRPRHRGKIALTAPAKGRSPAGVARHSSLLPPDEVTVRDGIPVTTVPRTIFDLAAVASATGVEVALRESEYLELHDRLSLLDLLERYPGRRGACAIRTCLERRAETPGRIRSPLEERFLPFLRCYHLPIPRLNAWVQAGER